VQRHAGSSGSSPATAGASLLADPSPANGDGVARQRASNYLSTRCYVVRVNVFQLDLIIGQVSVVSITESYI
jgi:hypothetical protein